jgi:hypothetical protein
MEGKINYSEWPARHRCLERVVYEGKIVVPFETVLFKTKINGIILTDMTRSISLSKSTVGDTLLQSFTILILHDGSYLSHV